MNLALLLNSLLVSAAATAGAMLGGVCVALLAVCNGKRIRLLLVASAILVLVLPPFLVTNTWIYLFGLNGAWRPMLNFNVLSLSGTAWVLALSLWPVGFLMVLGNWRQLHPTQLEVDPALRGGHLLRHLMLPWARPALTCAAIITFVLALNQFTIPASLQTKVLPAEMWVRYNTELDAWAAFRLALPLIIIPLALLMVARHRLVPWKSAPFAADPAVLRRALGNPLLVLAMITSIPLFILSLGVPLGHVLASPRTWQELPAAFGAGGRALASSIGYSAIAAAGCVAIGFMPWHRGALRATWLLFFIPGMLLAIALIWLANFSWTSLLFQTPALVLGALILRYVAIPASLLTASAGRIDPVLKDDARLTGFNYLQKLQHLYLPALAAPAALAWYCVYLLCLWDVETTLLLIPPGGESAALRAFNLLHSGYNAQVNALCLALLLAALVPGMLLLFLWCFVGRSCGRLLPCMAMVALLNGCSPSNQPGTASLSSRFFSEAQIVATRGTGAGEVNKPRSITVDTNGNVYVVDMTGRVQKFSADGVFLQLWQMEKTDLGRPKGLAIDRQGNVVVNEPHYSRVSHFSPIGELRSRWGEHGTNDGQIAFPRALAVNSRNEVYVSEYGLMERVQHFAPGGEKWLGAFGEEGARPGQLNRAEGLCVDSRDLVYVADSCNHRIQVFSETGELVRAFGSPGTEAGQLSYPYDIAVDAKGFQFVCEFGNSRIQVFDTNGISVEIIGGPGAAPGRFNNPWGVALDPQGNLYVADALNHRVQKLIRRRRINHMAKST